MKTAILTRLLHPQSLLPTLYKVAITKYGRLLSTDSTKVDEPFKVEEAETVSMPPPPSEKLLVLGGNGFVGSHVCKEALDRGLSVASFSRSGKSSIKDSWASNVDWRQGNLLSPDSFKDALDGVTSVISCVGGFGSNSQMYKINGTANINAIKAAAEKELTIAVAQTSNPKQLPVLAYQFQFWNHAFEFPYRNCSSLLWSQELYFPPHGMEYGFPSTVSILVTESHEISWSTLCGVKRFVYVSAADFGLMNYLLQGYYEGKRAAETELLTRFPYGGVILRSGFIHGTRRVGSMKLPLGVIGAPLEMVLQHAKPMNRVPLVGPLFTPPVSVTAVSKVAVRAATDPVFPPGIIDVYGILRYSQ